MKLETMTKTVFFLIDTQRNLNSDAFWPGKDMRNGMLIKVLRNRLGLHSELLNATIYGVLAQSETRHLIRLICF